MNGCAAPSPSSPLSQEGLAGALRRGKAAAGLGLRKGATERVRMALLAVREEVDGWDMPESLAEKRE